MLLHLIELADRQLSMLQKSRMPVFHSESNFYYLHTLSSLSAIVQVRRGSWFLNSSSMIITQDRGNNG